MLSLLAISQPHAPVRKHPRLLAVAALLALGALYLAFAGISIDASALRDDIARRFSESIGREVRFEGPLQLEVSAHPKLRAGGLHIANAAGFAGGEFASIGEVRLAVDLWPLFWLRLQIEELAGSDVYVRLQLHRDGTSNWIFNPSSHRPQPAQAPSAGQAADSKALWRVLARLDIKRVSLEKLNVEYIGGDAKSHFFSLTSLAAHFPAGQPVSLTLNGAVEKTYPYRLDLTGGVIGDLTRDRPWPIAVSLSFMRSQLSLNGSVSGSGGAVNFGLGTEDLREFERLFQTKLPAVGMAGISGVAKFAPGKVTLDHLSGLMGKTTLNGTLEFDYGGPRPKVRGELTMPVLDLRPFMTGRPAVEDEPSQSLAQLYRELAKAKFSLNELNSADADLTLNVARWINLPGAVHDATLKVKLDQGRLTVPVQATVADVMLSGSASADASVNPPRFQLALGAHDSSLGNLAAVAGLPDVKGHLGRLDLRIAARGDSGAELMESMDVRLQVEHGKLRYGDGADGHHVQFFLNDLAVALPAKKPLRGEAHGSLLDKAFSASLHGGSLTAIMQEAHAPIDLAFQAGSATGQLHALLQPPAENSGSEIAFELSAPHSGEIAGWFGLKPGTDVPVSLQGNFHTDNDSWHLADFALHLGHSAVSADVQRTFDKGKSLIRLQLTSDLIDVDELQALLPETREDAQTAAKPSTRRMIDIPILPNGISLADADIEVRIRRIASTSPFAVRDLRFDGHIRDGMMSASPFSANVAETNFSGTILLDLRSRQPRAELWLAADALNVGSVLNKLSIARNIDANIDHLRLHLDLHSSHLGQLLAKSELAVNFDGGQFTLRDANTGGTMRIALNSGELKSAPGAAVRLDLNGSLDSVPVVIGIETAPAVDLVNPSLSIPFRFSAATSGATIQLAGDIDRPFSQKDIELALDMRGARFDNLNPLVHASLPPWGPWSASGKFHMSSSGYEVSSLLLQVGSSQLSGQGRFDTQAVPPRAEVRLTAPMIQLDDFRFGGWSPERGQAGAANPEDQSRKQAGESENHFKRLLSREVLRRQNANVTVRVDQVLSGKDLVGSGSFQAQLKNGRADIGPVVVETPGGSASLQLGYDPGDTDVAFNLKAEVNRFDYGILARSIDPKSDMRGIFSLNVDVNARAHYLSELLRYGNGHIDFAVWPENMESGLLDIWAVNALMALLPAVDSSKSSKVNCAIARFVLVDGKLTGKKMLIDTSRMRVRGKGGANFATEKVRLYMQPRAKTPQFLSFAIPIELTGSFSDFHVGVRPADILETTAQLATSVFWVPMETLFGKTIPSDGGKACRDTGFN